ncbi:transcription regulator [Levilactobacillus namurensis DSM 19117]|uniref:Transcription regulator n=1 Tax=Levilactobacillus namurensis DSM 19117 TaxID=1423773 RepID=A0A0R1JT44_9LACO|nr:LysR family transcriptional regulator [Levilactobacillus namurensis]KRK74485.1 transcription regulator [Levilactobacillus namurensis DSM 19117]GEO74259.1 LysR family transcriptional regulator [Levilactobacillus namurensis]
MDIDKLKTFLQVAQYGSFKQAAVKQYRSQRAISKQITQIETELGVTLFWRHANRITLTPQGRFFQSSAQDMVNNYTQTLADLQAFNQQARRTLQVGYFSAFEERLLRQALFQMKKRDPNLYLTLREESNEHLVESVRNGSLDAALSINYGQAPTLSSPELATQPIFSGEMVMGVSTLNPLSQQKFLTPADLAGKPVLYYSPESSTFLLESFQARMPFMVDNQQIKRVTSVEQLQMAVALDQAMAFYPAGLLDQSLMTVDSHIVLLPVHQAPRQDYEIVVIYRRGNPNPTLADLFAQFKQLHPNNQL